MTLAPAAPAFSEISNIDDGEARAAHIQPFQTRRTRDQEIERANPPPVREKRISPRDVATDPTNALSRDRFSQCLEHRACPVHGIRIDHAVASLRHAVAGFDPNRRFGQWQWRIGRRAGEVAGAHRPAIGGGDVVGRKCVKRWPVRANAPQRIDERKRHGRDRLKPIQQRGKRDVERSERRRQALGRDHPGMVDQALSPWQSSFTNSMSSRRTSL
jgi:hypothetical protein